MKILPILLLCALAGCGSPYGMLGFAQGLQARSPYQVCTREPDHDVVCGGQPLTTTPVGIAPCALLPAPITMPQQPAQQQLVMAPDGRWHVMYVPQFTAPTPLPPLC